MIPACPDCDGTGRLPQRWEEHRRAWRQGACPDCDGTGRLSLAVLPRPRKHAAEPRPLRSVFSNTTEAAV